MSDTTISLKNSTTSGSVPASNLVAGEVAINIQDKKAWVGLASGTAPVLFVDFNAATITSGSITSGMIGNNAVNSGNIASGQVGLYHLASGTIFSLSSGIITSGFIGDNAVNSGNIASGQVSNYHLSSGAALGNLSSGSISSGTFILGDGVVTSGNIASGLLSNFTISSGSITSGLIGDNAVNSGNISSGAVGHFHISDNAVQSGNIASGQISHFHIANNAVQSGNISSGNVGLYKLDALTTTYTSNSGLLVGQVLTYNGSGMIWQDPDHQMLVVRNNTGVTMPKGSVVYISGGLGNKALVTLASASSEATSSKTIGVLQDDIDNNEEGRCLVSGMLEDVNTNSYAVGDRLYLSTTAGQWTTTRYQPPVGHQVYIGTVVRSHINFGRIAVTIQNGFEITELHDVRIMSGSTSSGQVLQYTAQSGGYWQNSMYSVGSGYISNNSILSGNIASGQIGRYHLSNNSVFSGHVSSSEIGSVHLNSGAAIGNLSSGSIKSGGWILGDGVVQSGNIASGQISNFHLSSGASTFNLLSGSVSNNQLANNAITINGASTVLGASYNNSTLTISTGLTGGSYNGSGAVTIALASGAAQTNLLSGTISQNQLSTNSVGSIQLIDNSVVSGKIASGQVGQFHLSSGTSIGNLSSGSIKSGGWILGNGVVLSGNLASGLIPTSISITSGSITSGLIGNGAVVSGSIASGQVSYPNIAINSGFIVGQVLTMTASGSLYFTFCDGGLI